MTSQATSDALDALTSQWGDALSELDSSSASMIAQLLESEATYGEVRMCVQESDAGWRVGVSTDARSNALPLDRRTSHFQRVRHPSGRHLHHCHAGSTNQ